jgi:hypothetical protein
MMAVVSAIERGSAPSAASRHTFPVREALNGLGPCGPGPISLVEPAWMLDPNGGRSPPEAYLIRSGSHPEPIASEQQHLRIGPTHVSLLLHTKPSQPTPPTAVGRG